jgi:hypothetical protein
MTLQEHLNFFYEGLIGKYDPIWAESTLDIHPSITNYINGQFITEPHKYSWRMLSVEDAKNILAHNEDMNKLRDKIELIKQKKLEIEKDFE